MKNSILILSIVLFSSHAFSQERTIDWQDLTNINLNKTLLKPVKNRNFAGFKIININKFLYEVSITGKNINIQTEVPDELKKVFRLSVAEQTKQSNNDKAENANRMNEQAKKIMSEISSNMLLTNNNKQKIDNIIIECSAYITKADAVINSLGKLKLDKIELENLAQQDLSFGVMKGKVNDLRIILNSITEYENLDDSYNKVKQLYNDAPNDITDTVIKSKIDNAFTKIKEAYTVIESEDFLTLYTEVKYLLDELQNEKNFIVVSPPTQMEDDFVNFKISANPVTTNTATPHNSKMEFSFDVPARGGYEVDFSVGPTVSFGNNAKGEKYYLENSTTVGNSYLRQRDNNNAGIPGMAAMMHIYKRSGTETVIGGLFGVGAGFQSINDVDLSFYLGGTIVLGKMQKVMLNSGLSFLRVDRLKEKQYSVGKEYTTQDFKLDDVVEKVFKPSLFISLSYSLAKRVDN